MGCIGFPMGAAQIEVTTNDQLAVIEPWRMH
jgi:hypothetical protein